MRFQIVRNHAIVDSIYMYHIYFIYNGMTIP